MTSWKAWLHGLLAGSLSAVGVTGSDYMASLIDGTPVNWHHLGVILGVTSLGAAFLYLRKSPIPDFPDFKLEGPATIQVAEGTTASVSTAPTSLSKIDPTSPVAPQITHP